MIDSSIATDMFPITPNDSVDQVCFAIKCKGSAGNVVVITATGDTRTIPFAAGEMEPCKFKRILATGTTATGLWGYKLYPNP